MKVSIFADNGALLWSRNNAADQPSGFTSNNYLCDGTQQKIIDALNDALTEASGQLRGSFEIPDVVSDVRATATEVNRRVPIAIAWNRDASR